MTTIFNKKNLKTLILILSDILCFVFCSYLALAIRFDFKEIPTEFLSLMLTYLPIDILVIIILFTFFGLYSSIWTYASITELMNIITSISIFELLNYVTKSMMNIIIPRSFYPIQLMLLIIFISGIRYSGRVTISIKRKFLNKKKSKRTMIIGCGEAGGMLINEITNNSDSFDNKVICAIDDDKNKVGKNIRNIPIVGTSANINMCCTKYNIDEIIIAIPSASKDKLNSIMTECQKTKCNIKILPKISTMVDASMKLVRPISYEDFLGRDEIVVNIDEIKDNITNKIVLVTGGGGSIGSELCRQITKCKPQKLIIFDIYENNAYNIQQELLRNYTDINLDVIIGSVRDYDKLETVFKKYKPNIVFHAAAHKHVPLMEFSPCESIKNNCLGTLNAAKLADKYNVNRFVLISTDKAVRPTNIMGASKRICEMIVQAYSRKSKTEYVAVRFGNVLGSNGSVIPLFLQQIDNGGPVTVTHKEITRFFMTIPEAVSLILQAGVYAKGGEIFVLDMGKPIKIYDLAEKLIKFKGYEPNKDIEIKVTGLRPGEKLYEEVLMDEEGLQETPNKLIHIGKPIMMDDNKFFNELDALIKEAYNNSDNIKEETAKIVTNYHIDKR